MLILGEGPRWGLDYTTLTAQAKYPVHYNGSNSFLFLNATKIYQFKATDSEMNDYKLCFNNMNKTGLFLLILILLILKIFKISINI